MKIQGLSLLVDWTKFKEGTSFFVPCIQPKAVKKEIEQEAARLKVNVICKQVVHNNTLGLRVWRAPAIIPPTISPPPSSSEG